jgi:hypothetical protein
MMPTFRVEFRPDGSLDSCIEMDRGVPEGVLVVYVEAKDSQHAIHRARQRLLQRERRARYDAEGQCKCGRPRDAGGQLCHTRRARNRAAKRGVSAGPKGPKHLARRADIRATERFATLLEVARVLAEVGPAFIGRWLDEQIEELVGVRKRRAA